MKELIIEFKVFRVDGGVRYESGENFIDFIGDLNSGSVITTDGVIGTYERDEYADLYVVSEGEYEYIGATELHYAIDFLAEAGAKT